MDATRVRPIGAWVLLKVDPPKTKSASGLLYLPEGNLEERLGQATATIMKVGSGKLDKKGRRVPMQVRPLDRVLFRGYLQEINRPGGFLDREYCLVHCDDLGFVIEE